MCWVERIPFPLKVMPWVKMNAAQLEAGYATGHLHAHDVCGTPFPIPICLQCEKYPGMAGHLELDAQTFASWEIDYLKVSPASRNNPPLHPVGCAVPGLMTEPEEYRVLDRGRIQELRHLHQTRNRCRISSP